MRLAPPVALVVALLAVVSLGTVPLAAVGASGGAAATPADPSTTLTGPAAPADPAAVGSGPAPLAATQGPTAAAVQHEADANATGAYEHVDGADDPSTAETIGYVEGYRYDDSLSVDDSGDAVVPEEDLEAVVYRAMARVEVIRGLPFQETVPVEVLTNAEFRAQEGAFLEDPGPAARQFTNASFEALFVVGDETDAVEELRSVYGASVAGYYDSATDNITLVSEDPDRPEVNEAILGHELLHALQDQHFGLEAYGTGTQDRVHATQGLVEGDGVWVERQYDQRCESEWSCVPDGSGPPGATGGINWGLFFTLYHPYSDGPHYVEHLVETGGLAALNAAYESPPNSSAEVIDPGEVSDPVAVDLRDRSTDDWERLDPEAGPATESFGEATIASAFMHQGLTDRSDAVVSPASIRSSDDSYDGFAYDHAPSDGWAGDAFYAYRAAGEDVAAADTAFVWRTAWTDAEEAGEFADAYETLLSSHGGEAVANASGDAATYELDGGFAGAYAVERDGETVTVVHAPSTAALDEVSGTTGGESDDDGVSIPDFGVAVAFAALALVVAAAVVATSRRRS